MRHSRSDEAINLAVRGKWEDAILVNQEILELSPNGIDALNRLGKALSEVGRNDESREAYERVIELDRHNNIARKNLDRLSRLKDGKTTQKASRGIDSRFFVDETSKARRINLHRMASRDMLGKMAAGDPVHLRVNGEKLEVLNDAEEYLGEVEPRFGTRLVRLIEGGNEYKAVIVNLWSDEVKVIIRETFQHSSQRGYSSFPPPKTGDEIRPYLKDSMVKREIEEEEFEDDDGDWGSGEEPLDNSESIFDGEKISTEKEELDKIA